MTSRVAAGEAPIRYLDAHAVATCLPSPAELLTLAELALRSLVAGAQVPPKAAVSGGGVFAHAMPARLERAAVPGGGSGADLLGMKWIAGASTNRARGLPAMAALIMLGDPDTGVPVA